MILLVAVGIFIASALLCARLVAAKPAKPPVHLVTVRSAPPSNQTSWAQAALKQLDEIHPPPPALQANRPYRQNGYDNVFCLRRYRIAKGLSVESRERYIEQLDPPTNQIIDAARWQNDNIDKR